MMASLLFCLMVSVYTLQTDGATFFGSPCPPGRQINKPFPYPEVPCSRCTCDSSFTFDCVTCGLVGLPRGPGCYLQLAAPNAPYPFCCRKEAVCPGDSTYDISKYEGK